MKLLKTFAKATNRIVHDLAISRGLEPQKGGNLIALIGSGRRHVVTSPGVVETKANVIAQYSLKDLMKATQDVAVPKIARMVQMMARSIMPQQPTLQPVAQRSSF